jgi:membrane protein DedA with SNARE-associated domain
MLPAVFDFLNGPVRDLVTQIYDAVGYLGVALWVAIESVIIPIPSELVLPFAGFLVGTVIFSIVGMRAALAYQGNIESRFPTPD